MTNCSSDLKLLTVCEAARRLRIHPDTLVRWCRNGIARPILDSGGRRIFTESEVDRLLEDRESVSIASHPTKGGRGEAI